MSESQNNNPLESLVIFDRLEVGPVRVERRSLTMPYRLYKQQTMEETALHYRYEEDVFEPHNLHSQGLAAMIGSQVALNYGLFCKEIAFRGNFDSADRELLSYAMSNTACEIYVDKFLHPNPFLIGEAAKLPVVKLEDYNRATLVFPDADLDTTPQEIFRHQNREHCYAVLSSGGKDSLLSFGLMRELGYETHPLFFNESGRHWFTALNAYRHFRTHIPHTARVWSDSDRLFGWFLRRMPFIRPDFANLRADFYPVRLWTVAVFIFGVLPLVLKHRLGRMLIGDEFDTTEIIPHHGIPYYNGLYDQSQFFDDLLTSYYQRKGWDLQQMSLLRPLSELLIQEILARRYPDLFSLQVSCHAAHKEQDLFKPCGKCEKCRRIVGMILIHDADPQSCGYSTEQIKQALKKISQVGVKQGAAETHQFMRLLIQKGLISWPAEKDHLFTYHPEVSKLRFDAVASPTRTIPRDIRSDLLNIFLEYADGATERQDQQWIDIPISSIIDAA
jgi:hypothetical protein